MHNQRSSPSSSSSSMRVEVARSPLRPRAGVGGGSTAADALGCGGARPSGRRRLPGNTAAVGAETTPSSGLGHRRCGAQQRACRQDDRPPRRGGGSPPPKAHSGAGAVAAAAAATAVAGGPRSAASPTAAGFGRGGAFASPCRGGAAGAAAAAPAPTLAAAAPPGGGATPAVICTPLAARAGATAREEEPSAVASPAAALALPRMADYAAATPPRRADGAAGHDGNGASKALPLAPAVPTPARARRGAPPPRPGASAVDDRLASAVASAGVGGGERRSLRASAPPGLGHDAGALQAPVPSSQTASLGPGGAGFGGGQASPAAASAPSGGADAGAAVYVPGAAHTGGTFCAVAPPLLTARAGWLPQQGDLQLVAPPTGYSAASSSTRSSSPSSSADSCRSSPGGSVGTASARGRPGVPQGTGFFRNSAAAAHVLSGVAAGKVSFRLDLSKAVGGATLATPRTPRGRAPPAEREHGGASSAPPSTARRAPAAAGGAAAPPHPPHVPGVGLVSARRLAAATPCDYTVEVLSASRARELVGAPLAAFELARPSEAAPALAPQQPGGGATTPPLSPPLLLCPSGDVVGAGAGGRAAASRCFSRAWEDGDEGEDEEWRLSEGGISRSSSEGEIRARLQYSLKVVAADTSCESVKLSMPRSCTGIVPPPSAASPPPSSTTAAAVPEELVGAAPTMAPVKAPPAALAPVPAPLAAPAPALAPAAVTPLGHLAPVATPLRRLSGAGGGPRGVEVLRKKL